MCIVIDINALPSVFVSTSDDHHEFEPVFDWIMKNNGKIVWGGNKYFDELKKTGKFLVLFRRLQDKRKVVKLPDFNKVDLIEKEIYSKVGDKKFNDPHIAAILSVSRCKIVCTKDRASIKYIKNKELYPKGFSIPKIFTHRSNSNLLNDANIVKICKPYGKLKKDEIEALSL